jgi:hypothetical protein
MLLNQLYHRARQYCICHETEFRELKTAITLVKTVVNAAFKTLQDSLFFKF